MCCGWPTICAFLLGDPAVMKIISFASAVIGPFNQMFH
jgi:hypothetical protein